MSAFPTLKVEVESVRHSLVTALAGHHDDIERAISDALAEVDIPAIVKAEVHRSIEPLIRAAVEQCVKSAVTSSLSWDWSLQREMEKAVATMIISKFANPQSDVTLGGKAE